MAMRKFLHYATKRGTPYGPLNNKVSRVYEIAAEARKEGEAAFKQNVETCPHPTGSINELAWWQGWNAAFRRAARSSPLTIE
jgi:hypothetical protein